MSTPQITVDRQHSAVRGVLRAVSLDETTSIELRAAMATLAMVDRHKDGLRILLLHLREQLAAGASAYDVPDPQQTRALLAHPAVLDLVATFPDLALYGTAPLARPTDGGTHGAP